MEIGAEGGDESRNLLHGLGRLRRNLLALQAQQKQAIERREAGFNLALGFGSGARAQVNDIGKRAIELRRVVAELRVGLILIYGIRNPKVKWLETRCSSKISNLMRMWRA